MDQKIVFAENNRNKSKSVKNRRILMAVVALLVCAAVFAAAWLLFAGKSARQFYLEAERRNFKTYSDQLKMEYKEFYESQQPYLTGIYKRRTEITADAGSDGKTPFGLDNAQGIIDLIQKSKLVVDSRYNAKEQSGVAAISLLLEKVPLLDAQLVSSGKDLYFTVPVLTPERYFRIDRERIHEVYERFGIPVRPAEMASLTGVAEKLAFNPEDLDRIAAEYGALISGTVTDRNVEYGKETTLTIAGKQVKGREVVVSLDSKEAGGLLKSLAEKAGQDDRLLKLTFGNVTGMSGLLDQAGLFSLLEYLKSAGILVLNDAIYEALYAFRTDKENADFGRELLQTLQDCEFPQGVRMKLVIDPSGNILDRKLEVPMKQTGSGEEYRMTLHTGSNDPAADDFRNSFADLEVLRKTASGLEIRRNFRIGTHFTPTAGEGKDKGRTELFLARYTGDRTDLAMTAAFDLEGSVDVLTKKRTDTVKYSVEMAADPGLKDRFTGEIRTVSWKNNKQKTRNWNTEFQLQADMPSFSTEGVRLKVSLAREDKLDIPPFQLPEIGQQGLVDLNRATDAELGKVQLEILTSFGSFYMNNKPIVDMILGN